jgi:hypothetical protein
MSRYVPQNSHNNRGGDAAIDRGTGSNSDQSWRGRTTLFLYSISTVIIALLALCGPAQAQERVAVELVLAVDTSISVSALEYRQQMSGIATALRDPEIVDIILNQPNGVAITLVHWSLGSLNYQAVDWHHLHSYASILEFSTLVNQAPRSRTGRGTAIGYAIDYATKLLETNAFVGTSRKIDISGDARSNSGPSPVSARDRAVALDITINALVIPDGDRLLESYYRYVVIGGDESFVMTADRNDDFATAMQRKLSRELNVMLSLNTTGDE